MVGSGYYNNSSGQDCIALVFTDSLYIYNTEENLLSAPYVFPVQIISGTDYYRGIAQGGVCDVVQANNTLYIFRGQEVDARKGTGGDAGNCGINLAHASVANNASVTVTAIMTNSFIHNYSVGDEVTVFNIIDGQHGSINNSYIVTEVTGTSVFKFVYTNKTGANINASTATHACCVRAKPPLEWDGSSLSLTFVPQYSIAGNIQTGTYNSINGSLPPSDFGLYYQNRIVCKFTNTNIAVSDILSESVDFTFNNFNINQGGNDRIIGVLPWVDNKLVIFMAKSIYLAYLEPTVYSVGGAVGINSTLTVITTEIGCLARKSIVSAGQYIFFLSGKGIHRLDPQLDLKLLGNTLPLSEPVDSFFDIFNFSAAASTVACYYDNRFFIAMPTNGSARPNQVLVYNTLNQNWETIDTYPYGLYVDDMEVCNYGRKRRLFITTRFNGLSVATVTADSNVVDISSEVDTMYVGQPIVSVGGLVSAIPANTQIQSVLSQTSFTMTHAATESGTVNMSLTFGGIFLTEEYENGDQFNSVGGTPFLPFTITIPVDPPTDVTSIIQSSSSARLFPIDARIKSREYIFGSSNSKRFSRAEFQFINSVGDYVDIVASTHDPDIKQTIMGYAFSGSNDLATTLRPRIALRGASIDIEIQFKVGRPALKSAVIYAIVANRNMISEE